MHYIADDRPYALINLSLEVFHSLEVTTCKSSPSITVKGITP